MSEQITGGARVYLRGCPHGNPGTVVKIEHDRVIVYWHDLDFLARHKPESLMVVQPKACQKNMHAARDFAPLSNSKSQAFAERSARTLLEHGGES